MFTSPAEGEDDLGERRMKMSVSIVGLVIVVFGHVDC